MKRKLYYLIIKITKCKPLATFLSNLISAILKGFYFIFSVFCLCLNKTQMSSELAREKLNSFSQKPQEFNNANQLNKLDETIDLSIIIPAYNVENTIIRCLDSVLNQKTEFNYEVIVVNDGSKDKTQEVIENYQYIQKIRLINQENKGLSGARNTGVEFANGKYLFFLDSDDSMIDNSIDLLMNLAFQNDAAIVTGSYNTVYNGKITKNELSSQVCTNFKNNTVENIFHGFAWGKVFKRELFKNVRFPESYLFEDTIMAFLIYPLVEGFTVVSSSESVCNYYKNDEGITATYSKKPKCIDAYWIIEKMYDEYIKVGLPQNENLFNLIFGHLKITFWRTYRLDKNLRKAIFILSCDLMEKVTELKPNKEYNLYEKNLLKAYKTRNFNLWNITSLIMD